MSWEPLLKAYPAPVVRCGCAELSLVVPPTRNKEKEQSQKAFAISRMNSPPSFITHVRPFPRPHVVIGLEHFAP